MKILVTGGAGFIGSNIVDSYLNAGHEVTIVDNLSTGKLSNINPKANFYNIDINSSEFHKIVEKISPDVINHHAAQIDIQTSLKEPLKDAEINIGGTLNVLEAAKSVKAKLIYPSSAAVYGSPQYLGIDEEHQVKPISTYGISKHTPEHYIEIYHQQYGLEYTIFRYANVFGKRQDPKGEGGVISILIDKVINDEVFTIFGDGLQTRDFIYVNDVVEANLLVLNKMVNSILNIGTGIPTSINELVLLLENKTGKKVEKKNAEERFGDIKDSYFEIEKAKQLINWKSKISVSKGLKETFEYYLEDSQKMKEDICEKNIR